MPKWLRTLLVAWCVFAGAVCGACVIITGIFGWGDYMTIALLVFAIHIMILSKIA